MTVNQSSRIVPRQMKFLVVVLSKVEGEIFVASEKMIEIRAIIFEIFTVNSKITPLK